MSRRGMKAGRTPGAKNQAVAELAYTAYGEWCDSTGADKVWDEARSLRGDGLLGEAIGLLEYNAGQWLETKCVMYRGLAKAGRDAFRAEVFEHIAGGLL